MWTSVEDGNLGKGLVQCLQHLEELPKENMPSKNFNTQKKKNSR